MSSIRINYQNLIKFPLCYGREYFNLVLFSVFFVFRLLTQPGLYISLFLGGVGCVYECGVCVCVCVWGGGVCVGVWVVCVRDSSPLARSEKRSVCPFC